MVIRYQPRLPDESVNLKGRYPLFELLVLVGKILGSLVGAYLLLGLAVDFLAPYFPPFVEKSMETNYLSGLKGENTDAQAEKHLQKILRRLTAHDGDLTSQYSFHIHVVENDLCNAISYPEGHIVVYYGLLKHLHTDDEIAFVLGHELGHYAHKDHLRGLGRSLILLALSSITLGNDNEISQFISNSLSMAHLHFSRQQEFAADHYGVVLMEENGFRRQGAIDVLTVLKSQEPWTLDFLETHPATEQRLKALVN